MYVYICIYIYIYIYVYILYIYMHNYDNSWAISNIHQSIKMQFEYLENEKSFSDETKSIFHKFLRAFSLSNMEI